MARSVEILLKSYEIYSHTIYRIWIKDMIQMNQYAIPTMCSNLLYLDERGQYLLWLKMKIAKWI